MTTPLFAQASPLAFPIERLAGLDRVETAIDISNKGWQSAETVILSEYQAYADSIASTPFAVSLNAPILLTPGNSIDPRVIKELERLDPQKVILLGGDGVLKPSIEKELTQHGFSSNQIERIGGANRYETSILLAKRLNSDSLILANGDDFPDALSAASYAGIKKIPIVLTSSTLPSSVIDYYHETQPQNLIVIGGEGVIPSDDLNRNHFIVKTRLGGVDRYETNAKVVSAVQSSYESNHIFLASGLTFPDAVAGTVLASKYKAPLLLSEKDDIPPSVYALMREHMQVEPPRPAQKVDSEPTPQAQKGQIVASGGLRLRETATGTGNVLLTIPEGTIIELNTKVDQWYQTTYQSTSGWVSADYVQVVPPEEISQNSGSPTQLAQITANGGVNLRDTPSSAGAILLTVPNGATIDLSSKDGQWYQTTYQSTTGWVSADYVRMASENSSNVDLTINGTVMILGGTGVISSQTQNIIEGKTSSTYPANLKDFPTLPTEIKKPEPPSRGGTTPPTTDPITPPTPTYDPSKEVPIDPFNGFPGNALNGKNILVDPGHGGPDPGAVGPTQTYEKVNSLAIALALKDILEQAGATVILTRDQDVSPVDDYSEINDLQGRVNIANNSNADLFISIHNDSFTNPEAHGTSTFYDSRNPKSNESLHLANSIQTAFTNAIETTDRRVKEGRLYVLANTNMPAILLETAFISNPYEEARLQNPTFQKNVAAVIFHGIYNYYKDPVPQS